MQRFRQSKLVSLTGNKTFSEPKGYLFLVHAYLSRLSLLSRVLVDPCSLSPSIRTYYTMPSTSISLTYGALLLGGLYASMYVLSVFAFHLYPHLRR